MNSIIFQRGRLNHQPVVFLGGRWFDVFFWLGIAIFGIFSGRGWMVFVAIEHDETWGYCGNTMRFFRGDESQIGDDRRRPILAVFVDEHCYQIGDVGI